MDSREKLPPPEADCREVKRPRFRLPALAKLMQVDKRWSEKSANALDCLVVVAHQPAVFRLDLLRWRIVIRLDQLPLVGLQCSESALVVRFVENPLSLLV